VKNWLVKQKPRVVVIVIVEFVTVIEFLILR